MASRGADVRVALPWSAARARLRQHRQEDVSGQRGQSRTKGKSDERVQDTKEKNDMSRYAPVRACRVNESPAGAGGRVGNRRKV